MPTQAEARTDSAPLTERRLRIGYLSGDFRIHPVMFFLEPVLARHDRQRFEIFCYADVAKADRMTERAHALAEQWRDIAGRSDDEVAAMMAADDIDLLVDLAGHTSTRLRLMARRIAPVQLSYLGYAFTSGLDTIDYRLSDALLDKPGDERLYSERLLRLEPTCYTYQPPEGAPDAAAAPCLRNGYLTFGATSRAHKINPATIALWASALKACGNSRLLLIARLFSDPRAQERLAEDFAAEGIDASRLDFVGELPFEAYLEAHAKIDLLLDAVPWNGHTNTLHALWMGVPTLTLCGDHHCARFGEMIMRHLDLPRFIAADEDDFALRAAEIDREHHSLSDLRAGLRARLRQSPLCDHIGVTRAIEAAYLRAFAERREIRD